MIRSRIKQKHVLIIMLTVIIVSGYLLIPKVKMGNILAVSDKSTYPSTLCLANQDINSSCSVPHQISKAQDQNLASKDTPPGSTNNLSQKTKAFPNGTLKASPTDSDSEDLERLLNQDNHFAKRMDWMERRLREFYVNITKEQLEKGEMLLKMVHATMGLPKDLSYEAKFYKADSNTLSYSTQCFYKYPSYYREDAAGQIVYGYRTDGNFEVTDYMATKPELIPRDGSGWMYLEMFPVRIEMDTRYVWKGEGRLDVSGSKASIETDIMSNWFYDMHIGKNDHLIHEISYKRMHTPQELSRIHNIQYKEFEVYDSEKNVKTKYNLPVKYTVSVHDLEQTQDYTVELSYGDNFNANIPQEKFYLSLPKTDK